MITAKQKMNEVILNQPEDATYAQILKELAFEQMIDRGLKDSRNGHCISNDEMKLKITSWKS